MDPTGSQVPAVLEALVARLTDTMTGLEDPADDWQVLDAGPGGNDVEPDVLIVGFADFDGTAVTSDVQRSQGMGHRYTETYEIRCMLSAERGDDDTITEARARVVEGLALVEAALTADNGVGGVVDQAQLSGSQAWAQAYTPQGATCEVAFTIQCRVTR
jgi:hypothetical protein